MLSILCYIILLVYTLVSFVILCAVFLLTVPFDRKRRAIHLVSRLWATAYFRLVPGWSVKIEGRENARTGGPYVVVVNHRSMLDIILMYAVPLNFRWVSKKEVYKWPIFGAVLWMHGDITIARGTASAVKQLVHEGGMWLSRGVSVMIFPEGSRGKKPEVGRFHEGAFLLAKKTGVGILPVVAEGTGTSSKGWRVNFRNRYRVRILPPVDAEQVQQTPVKDMTTRIQALMAEEYDRLRDETGNYDKY